MTFRPYRKVRGLVSESIYEISKIPGPNLAITVRQYSVFTGNTLEPGSERTALAQVTSVIDQFHMAILNLINNLSSAVSAAIVYHQDLIIVRNLSELIDDSKYGISDEACFVVGRHYDGDSTSDKSVTQA